MHLEGASVAETFGLILQFWSRFPSGQIRNIKPEQVGLVDACKDFAVGVVSHRHFGIGRIVLDEQSH